MFRSYKVATVEKDWLLDTICSHEIKPLSGRFRQEGNLFTVFFVRLYFAIDGHREIKESWLYFPTCFIVLAFV